MDGAQGPNRALAAILGVVGGAASGKEHVLLSCLLTYASCIRTGSPGLQSFDLTE